MANCRNCGRKTFFFQLKKGLCCNCIRETERQQEQITNTHHEQASISPPAEAEASVIQKPATNSTPKEVPETPKPVVTKKYRVTGMAHYMDNLMSLSYEEQDYFLTKKELIEENYIGERVWRYGFDSVRVELAPEPDNPADPKAIKVLVKGVHVGYIKAGSCAHLLKVLREDRIKKIECEIFGGPYKYIDEEYDYECDKEIYTLEKGDAPYAVHLTIEEE